MINSLTQKFFWNSTSLKNNNSDSRKSACDGYNYLKSQKLIS